MGHGGLYTWEGRLQILLQHVTLRILATRHMDQDGARGRITLGVLHGGFRFFLYLELVGNDINFCSSISNIVYIIYVETCQTLLDTVN